jgi:Ribbon-helix-helix protein, copG family
MAKTSQRGGKRPGAGRPTGPDGPTVTMAVSVPESLLGRLDAMAEQNDWSRSEAVTRAIKRLLGPAPRSKKTD